MSRFTLTLAIFELMAAQPNYLLVILTRVLLELERHYDMPVVLIIRICHQAAAVGIA